MKKLMFISVLLLFAIVSYSDSKITRGPSVGEIYYIGPTYTGLGLYHSTDFGETAVCMDSSFTTNIMSICADITPGIVYYVTMQEGLYISYDYGNIGTWQFRNSGIKIQINSGVQEGYIYSSFSKHSENYGVDFFNHNYNGFFGSKLDVEIDNEYEIGYTVVNKYNILDSIFLLISYDNFDSFELQKSFKMSSGYGVRISRGLNEGEMFLYNKHEGRLLVTQNYGSNWIETNKFNTSSEIYDITGGKYDQENFVLYNQINMMWQNAHTYILHSNDYGITYDLFHPFSKGQVPLVSNFSAKVVENDNINLTDYDSIYFVTGVLPLDVKFYNYSIGNISNYEWDFNNDSLVDSFEQSPTYTYIDTGWFSVVLTIFDEYDTNSFLRENYVYVDKETGVLNFNQAEIKCYPNPFSDYLNIILPPECQSRMNTLTIYDNSGNVVRIYETNEYYVIWDGKNDTGTSCSQGIYFLKLNNNKCLNKVLLTF